MVRVKVTKEIALPAEKAWQLIDDFGAIQNFHPLVRESGTVGERSTGQGAERFCDFGKGNRVRERIVSYEAGESMTIAITDTAKFPLKEAIAKLSVEPRGAARSAVTFDFELAPKYGPLGWVMGSTIMAAQFRGVLESIIDGLESYGLPDRAPTASVPERRWARAR